MVLSKYNVVFFHEPGLVSDAIAIGSTGPGVRRRAVATHCGLQVGEMYFESIVSGVQCKPWVSVWSDASILRIVERRVTELDAGMVWLREQVGKRYPLVEVGKDFVARYLSWLGRLFPALVRPAWSEEDCSELCYRFELECGGKLPRTFGPVTPEGLLQMYESQAVGAKEAQK